MLDARLIYTNALLFFMNYYNYIFTQIELAKHVNRFKHVSI